MSETENIGLGVTTPNAAITVIILILIIVLICQISCYSIWNILIATPLEYISQITVGKGQRTFPNKMIDENPDGMYKQMILAIADIKFDADKLFLVNYTGDKDFPHIYDSQKEREQNAKLARAYFKKQYGLSDTYMDYAMVELRVNPKIKYRAYFDQEGNTYNYTMKDGGYVVYIPPFFSLGGRYGGKDGVVLHDSGILAHGHYKIYDNENKLVHKILYTSPCPLQIISRYDADYTPVDCDVEVLESTNKKLIGLKGKAQGLNRNLKITGPKKNHVLIKNVMTFYD